MAVLGSNSGGASATTMKTLSLVLLALQNSTLILFMHYSRIMPLVGGQRYIPSTAVLTTEILKFTVSLTMALYETQSKLQHAAATTLLSTLLQDLISGDSWKMAIPATLYTLQNSLQYIAASHLDASTMQITYQLKILTTAMFSVILLQRKITSRKWLALCLLAVGVIIIQVPLTTVNNDLISPSGDEPIVSWIPAFMTRWLGTDRRNTAATGLTRRSATYQGMYLDEKMRIPHFNSTVGLLAVIIACVTSGLAGVYFEKILKDFQGGVGQGITQKGNHVIGLWIRNAQLSFYSLFPALFIGVLFNDGEQVSKYGFFSGYNWVVGVVVLLQAFGGILVSLVIKYANNIAKNFATSIGIIISFVVSFLFLDLEPSFHYVLGASIVIISTWLYNSQEAGILPSVRISDVEPYEKAPATAEQSYYDESDTEVLRVSRSKSKKEGGLSTSRTSTPSGVRTSSARRQFNEKRST